MSEELEKVNTTAPENPSATGKTEVPGTSAATAPGAPQGAEETASRGAEEKKPIVSGVDPSKAPVPTNLGVAVITVLYILFVIAVTVGLIVLSVFLFGKLRAWIFG
ncbi:MAG: hypothetical protein J5750_01840 [Clostridiales bacterium]|nr:hypothetical protein [Clostridiales bacterium]